MLSDRPRVDKQYIIYDLVQSQPSEDAFLSVQIPERFPSRGRPFFADKQMPCAMESV